MFSHIRSGLRSLRNVSPILYWSPTVLYFSTQVFIFSHIKGRSMQPTLNPDSSSWSDVGVFSCIPRYYNSFCRGDIVTFCSPVDPRQKLVKRIVATEGEVVPTLPPYPDTSVRIPKGHVWVQGDEPFHSDDSNLFGPIPAALIESKLVFIAWPLSRFGYPPERDLTSRNDDAYRHAMGTFAKDRTRSAKVTFDGITKY